MGRTLENKQQIVGELKELLADAELALVLDFKGLSIKEMSDLRDRLRASDSVCKVTKNTLMRRAIDGDSNWASLDSLLTGTNAFVLVKGDVGAGVKAVQTFRRNSRSPRPRAAFSKASSCLRTRSKPLPISLKEQLMAQIAGAINAVPRRSLWASTRFPLVWPGHSSSTPKAAKADSALPRPLFIDLLLPLSKPCLQKPTKFSNR